MRKPLTHVLSFQVFLFLFFLFLSLFSGYIGFIKYKEPFFGLFGAQESRILLVKVGTTKEDTWRLFIGWHKPVPRRTRGDCLLAGVKPVFYASS